MVDSELLDRFDRIGLESLRDPGSGVSADPQKVKLVTGEDLAACEQYWGVLRSNRKDKNGNN